MFEEYLQDAYLFATEARTKQDSREAQRLYRAAVFHAAGALEAFVNYIGNTLATADRFALHEIALLTDQKFGLAHGAFSILSQQEFHRLEDKLIFLMKKFGSEFDRSSNPNWAKFIEFKRLRDSLTHPRTSDDEKTPDDYDKAVSAGLSSIIELIDCLCKAVFKKRLRKQIRDLTL